MQERHSDCMFKRAEVFTSSMSVSEGCNPCSGVDKPVFLYSSMLSHKEGCVCPQRSTCRVNDDALLTDAQCPSDCPHQIIKVSDVLRAQTRSF